MYIIFKNYDKILHMKNFKKRTIALVLASVITVAGSFAAGNYKNSLMSLKFDTAENGSINMSVETKAPYSGNVKPVQRDANTYMLTLSEMNSMIKGVPNLEKVSGNITSVEIKTLPYSNNAKGYTRVIIKTHNPINIQAENKIYIPSNDETTGEIADNNKEESNHQETFRRAEQSRLESIQRREEEEVPENLQEQQKTTEPDTFIPDVPQKAENIQPEPVTTDKTFTPETPEKDPYQVLMTVMGILAVFGIIAFLAVRAANKIHEVTGEKMDIDTSDENDTKPKKESKRKKIKNTIKQLDNAYSKTAVRPSPVPPPPQAPVKAVKPAEELNVVDLDALFQEHQEKAKEDTAADAEQIEEEENDALDEFLSGFSFDEQEEEQQPLEEKETTAFNEEVYNKIIEANNISFTTDDIDCMKQLLSTEINDEAIKNINDYAPSSPIKTARPSKESILEDLVINYKISQDITFSADDINTLRKLISVELDNDFINDLKTNPERIRQTQEEIEASRNKSRKPSEILTLNVKDMLPDLSEALRKQGGRKIESEVKPITVYASEGYEVSTLSLKDELPDLSKEIYNQNSYISKPSAELELVDNSYEVEKLSLTDTLPDLNDVLKNPEKYEKPQEESVKVDEDALLKNISNVQFKPFYDGNEDFEILNDFDTPSMDDIQNEFDQFGNFEISKEEEEEYSEVQSNNDYDDFTSLYSNEYFDLDKIQQEPQQDSAAPEPAAENIKPQAESTEPVKEETKEETKEEFKPLNLERKRDENIAASKRVRTKSSEDILKKIQAVRAERIERKEKTVQNKAPEPNSVKEKNISKQPEIKCIIDGETYTIVSTTEFSENKGCHLAKKSSGYTVLGYIDDKFIKIKDFDTLKSERIASRLSEKLSDKISRYIIRIGLNKFVVNVTENNIEYLMAL